MSPNRKADLQRKLAMAPVPKPPAGLAERIKSDIPQHLLVDARRERQRLSQSIAFNLRVAASVIFLVLSVYLALHVLSRAERDTSRMAMEKPANVVVVAGAKAKPQAAQPAAPARIAEATPPPELRKRSVEVPAPAPALEPKPKREEATRETAAAEPATQFVPAAPPPPRAVAEAAAPANATAKTAMGGTAGFVADAAAAPIALAPATLFDIAVTKPDLIQRFAAPAAPPRALRVDAEAVRLDEWRLLRVSVDTPDVEHPDGGSRPPVAAAATLDIAFDDDAVVSHRALAGTTASAAAALPSSTSVTALFAVELKPGLASRTTIATVTLRYRSVSDGEEHVVTRKLRAADVRAWEKASRRMKGASLAAALMESLEPASSIAEKARAAGLDELAEIAEKR